jgi:hypothetical protein
MTDRKIKLQSFHVHKSYGPSGDYQATIKIEGEYGEQTLKLTSEQIVRVLDAALEALAEAATAQADLIRRQVTAELENVIAAERAKMIAAPVVEDAEIAS